MAPHTNLGLFSWSLSVDGRVMAPSMSTLSPLEPVNVFPTQQRARGRYGYSEEPWSRELVILKYPGGTPILTSPLGASLIGLFLMISFNSPRMENQGNLARLSLWLGQLMSAIDWYYHAFLLKSRSSFLGIVPREI